MILLWVSVALAAMPDKNPATYAWADPPKDLVLSADGSLIAAVSEAGAIRLVSVDTWRTATSTVCDASSVVLGDGGEVWVGCKDGSVHQLAWDGAALSPATDSTSGDALSWELSEGELLALFQQGDELYALADEDSDLVAHSVDPATGAVDGAGYPFTLVYDGYVDAAALGQRMVIAHGADDISSFSWAGGGAISSTQRLGVSLEDIAATTRESILGVDKDGFVVEYLLSSSTWMIHFNTLDEPTAVDALSLTSEERLYVGDGTSLKVWSYGSGTMSADAPDAEVSISDTLAEIAAGEDYAWATTTGGDLLVFTDLPWVSEVEAFPATVGEGDEVVLSFTSDVEGEYAVHLGGDRTGSGAVIATGTASVGAQQVQLTAGSDWPEGALELVVLVDDGAGTGHGLASVLVDNPPGAPSLDAGSLSFSSGALILSFEGIVDADLDHYTVYLSTTPFTGEEWPSGGPAFDGADEIEAPVTVTAAGGESVYLRLEPLTDGVTYYLGVRATDAGGLEGPMSVVVEGTPRPAYGAAEISGEQGGAPECGPGLGGSMGWLALFGGLVAVRRRRSLAVAGGLLLAGTAGAKDYTPTVGNLELRYGPVQFDQVPDPVSGELVENPIDSVYNERSPNVLQVEVGPQLFRVLEVDVGFGFLQQLAWKMDEAGARSGDRTMLTSWPLSVSGTLRLQFWDEQVAVPFASYGYDYLLWDERWDDGAGGKDRLHGAKVGQHWAVGGNLLLDTFARARASTLESQTGVNDTFVVVEYRRQDIGDGEGLVFSGDMVTAGLKLDF
ncbi:MAG: hypothetical protein JXX28_06345 [Deltaproteobacteria bacterium]|nr:hypothetical protein [Deltaproteobacteria bacterium]